MNHDLNVSGASPRGGSKSTHYKINKMVFPPQRSLRALINEVKVLKEELKRVQEKNISI